jgi:hypothetical protein
VAEQAGDDLYRDFCMLRPSGSVGATGIWLLRLLVAVGSAKHHRMWPARGWMKVIGSELDQRDGRALSARRDSAVQAVRSRGRGVLGLSETDGAAYHIVERLGASCPSPGLEAIA